MKTPVRRTAARRAEKTEGGKMKVREIVNVLEEIAPPHLAAEWDNVGLLVGNAEAGATRLMLCIDLTEQVLREATRARVGMVMAYHPPLFKAISRVTVAENPVIYDAASAGVAVYSMHTALDAAPGGANDALAELLGIAKPRALEPVVRRGGYKVVIFAPADEVSKVADAAFEAGAGRIANYERCAFFSHGIGTFFGAEGSKPTVGRAGRQEAAEELRLEVIAPKDKVSAICSAVRAVHSYEAPAIDIYPLEEAPAGCGLGRIGRLKKPATVGSLISRIKKKTQLKKVLLAVGAGHKRGDGRGRLVTTAACCVGSCGSLFRPAAAAGATFYLTGEMRHHDALEAIAAGLDVVCLGHSNSERIALAKLAERLSVKLPKVKVLLSDTDRDPFNIV